MSENSAASIAAQVKELELFRDFEPDALSALLDNSSLQDFPKGATIIKEGNYDNRLYVLLKGGVTIVKNGAPVNRLSSPGEIFGEMCIIDGAPRSADVVTNEDSRCLVTDMSFLDKSDKSFTSRFYHLVAEVMASRLRRSDQNMSTIVNVVRGIGNS